MTETVTLAGQPVDEESLERAQRTLTGMMDIGPGSPPWIIAARLAVREALQEEA